MNSNFIASLSTIQDHLKNLDDFLEVNNERSDKFKEIVKIFYDNLRKCEDVADTSGDALSGLLIENFDDEQIYQQLQLHFNSTNNILLKNFSKFLSIKHKITFNLIEDDEEDEKEMLEKGDDKNNELDKDDDENTIVEDDQDLVENNEHGEDFNDDFEKFESKLDNAENDEIDDDEDDVEEEFATDVKHKSSNLFDDESDDDNDEDLHKESTFEKRQTKLNETIDKVHDSMIDNFVNKPWQLKGEVSAKNRPQESLIEEYLQFDHTTKQMPLNTAELSKKIEDLIKQRIKDKAYDDVERKIKPIDMPNEYKKEIQLDHEKSKIGLSQVYEQEYLNTNSKKDDGDVRVNPAHEQIRIALQSLFVKLDALSNFHYKPKPQINDFKITSNIATISMEDVAPITVSNTNVLAPNEIHENINKLPKTKGEKNKKEKKRDLKDKRLKIKKTKIKENKLKNVKGEEKIDKKTLKNLKKPIKSAKVDANASLQVFNPLKKKSKDNDASNKNMKKAENVSAKRLKI